MPQFAKGWNCPFTQGIENSNDYSLVSTTQCWTSHQQHYTCFFIMISRKESFLLVGTFFTLKKDYHYHQLHQAQTLVSITCEVIWKNVIKSEIKYISTVTLVTVLLIFAVLPCKVYEFWQHHTTYFSLQNCSYKCTKRSVKISHYCLHY